MINLILSIFFTLLEFNCENLFDCQHDEGHQDYEYLADGVRHWTRHKYWKKLDDVSRVIVSSAEASGRLPDLVALCEVANDSVMECLSRRSLLHGAGYQYLMTTSRDVRGIDVALLYQPVSFLPVRHYSMRVDLGKGTRPTRDILYVAGRMVTGDTLHVFVVHAPSRLGGAKASASNRMKVAERLVQAADSIRLLSPLAHIVVAGDFNDEAADESIVYLGMHGLKDVAPLTDKSAEVQGSYRYKGHWQTIDHVLVSERMETNVIGCRIHALPYMLEPDPTYGGVRPKRTYWGGRYLGGCSDHLPLLLQMKF